MDREKNTQGEKAIRREVSSATDFESQKADLRLKSWKKRTGK